MELTLKILPIIAYSLLIVFLIVGIILGVKTIKTIKKVDKVVDDVNEKVQSLNPVFSIIDYTTDRLAGLSDRIVEFGTMLVTKLFNKKKGERINEEESEKDE
jgi:uncharacterized protein YoxC